MLVWSTIARFIADHGAAVLVTLAETHGSSPREAGARMVVRPDGGFSGTIGGGTLEWVALAEAQAMLAHRENAPFRRLDKVLGPGLGQCCGGRVIVTLERFDAGDQAMVKVLAEAEQSGPLVTIAALESGRPLRRPAAAGEIAELPRIRYARLPDGRVVERFGTETTPLYLFGAGHVGRSLVLALAPLPFSILWVDPRPGAFPQHVPVHAACVVDEPATTLERAPNGAFVAIMTHSHALDLDLTAAALKAGRFPYVGLIGSATKRARFVNALRKFGIAQDAIDRLICPIGLTEISDKAPAAIAASVVAQLLIERDRLALGAAGALTSGVQSPLFGIPRG